MNKAESNNINFRKYFFEIPFQIINAKTEYSKKV